MGCCRTPIEEGAGHAAFCGFSSPKHNDVECFRLCQPLVTVFTTPGKASAFAKAMADKSSDWSADRSAVRYGHALPSLPACPLDRDHANVVIELLSRSKAADLIDDGREKLLDWESG